MPNKLQFLLQSILSLGLILCFSPALGQSQLTITSLERTDHVNRSVAEPYLVNQATQHKIIYTLDSMSQQMTTDRFMKETYYSRYRDTFSHEKIVTKYKKWPNQFSLTEFLTLRKNLQTDIDSLGKDDGTFHTSHHYFNLYLTLIHKGDTLYLFKTKPFGYLSPWRLPMEGSILNIPSVLNPSIDEQVLALLPQDFQGREKFMAPPFHTGSDLIPAFGNHNYYVPGMDESKKLKKFHQKFETVISFTQDAYWSSIGDHYLLGYRNDEWQLYICKPRWNRFSKRKKRLDKPKMDALFSLWNEKDFWELSNDSLNVSEESLPLHDSLTLVHIDSISDGQTNRFEMSHRGQNRSYAVYEPEHVQASIPTKQRAQFIICKNAFLELFQ